MQTVNPARFRRFLRRRCARKDLADRAFALFRPLIDIARKGEYPLSPEGTVPDKNIAAVIARATGAACEGVILVRSARPVREGWTTEEDYVTHFPDIVLINRKEVLLDAIGDDLKAELVIEMHMAFLDEFLTAFMASHHHLVHILEWRLFQAFWSTPALAVFYLSAYAIAGDEAGFDDLAPLVELLPHAVPLGETWADLERWLVLVK